MADFTEQEEFEFRRRRELEVARTPSTERRGSRGGSPRQILASLLGLGEAGLQLGTGLAREAVAGASGATQDLVTGPLLDIAGVPRRSGADVIEQLRADIPIYRPSSVYGKQLSGGLEQLGGAIDKGPQFLGDKTLDATGSPALASAAYSIPYVAATLAAGGVKPKVGAPLGATSVFKERGGTLRELGDVLTGNIDRLVRRHHQSRVGSPEDIAAVTSRLEKSKELIPGDKPTAAEALVGVPEGSPIVADQKLVASQAGGPSARFGERKLEQNAAREKARKSVEKDLGPVRERLLDEANRKGATDANLERPVASGEPPHTGIKFGGVKTELRDLKKIKGRSEIADKVIGAIEDRLAEKVQPNGLIDARDLYALRKDLGKTIQDFAETGVGKNKKGWGKGQTRHLMSEIMPIIDSALENAIQAPKGKGWRAEYMDPYSTRLQRVEASEVRAKNSMRPVQATTAAGVKAGKEAAPHVFSRTASIFNYLLGGLRKRREPAMLELMAKQYRDPALLAKAIRGERPVAPGPRAAFSTRGAIPGYMAEAERRRQMAAQALRQ